MCKNNLFFNQAIYLLVAAQDLMKNVQRTWPRAAASNRNGNGRSNRVPGKSNLETKAKIQFITQGSFS